MKTQTGSSYVALIFLETRCYMRGVWPLPLPGRFTPRKEILYPFYRRVGGPQTGLDGCRKSHPNRDSIHGNRPARSESLY